ncbi:enoyl-hydratase [Phlyctema vagabunda]|uniref:Enoyl-hydratase n=1 Tax=Phlyctema vagabunda TaxID=108571 RepID=A0ABR4P8B2_9HELO
MSHPPCITAPPPQTHSLITFPQPSVVLVTFNRPLSLNAMSDTTHHELQSLFSWLDNEPLLRVAIITGSGRAFCAGADLKEWNSSNSDSKYVGLPLSGFGGMSRREGKKPIIAAVNGLAYGGGCEMVINADMVVASEGASFALPEGKRGVVAVGGSLTRLMKTVGKQRAMEMALTGRVIHAKEAEAWGLVNVVVSSDQVLQKALEMSKMIVESSPDSIIVTRKGVMLGWDALSADEGTGVLIDNWYPRINKGENMVEGVAAFVGKRVPRWIPSKL